MSKSGHEHRRQYERERRAKFTPEQKAAAAQHAKLYMQHRRNTDASYLERVREHTRRLYKKHRAKRIAAMREKHWRTRVACLRAYSPNGKIECNCCGEDILEFLTLDHVQDWRTDGGVRVGGTRVGQTLYAWLIRMGFPAGFRVRCYNCNCGRNHATDGRCPHEREREIQDMAV